MRLAFAGTPAFAAVALEAMADAGFTPALVLTQPDRPAGRGMRLQASEVKRAAMARSIAVLQPASLRLNGPAGADAAACRDALQAADIDLMVVAAYGLILPRWVLDDLSLPHPDGRPRHGCINIHASLLPRWRGAAPIHRAIEAGDAVSGVCIMQMDQGLDTGDVIRSASVPIRHDGDEADTTASLHDRLAALGAELLLSVLRQAGQGPLPRVPQPSEGVSYARKVERAEACIDWARPAAALDRQVRAFNPTPVAWTGIDGQVLKVWRARPLAQASASDVAPGTVLAVDADGINVATGEGVLQLREVQRAGARRMTAAEFARGQGLRPGARLGDAGMG